MRYAFGALALAPLALWSASASGHYTDEPGQLRPDAYHNRGRQAKRANHQGGRKIGALRKKLRYSPAGWRRL